MGLGFPKSARLLKSSEYTDVLRRPNIKMAAGPLRLRAIRHKMRGARLGLVVTKKGNSRAVRRNRIKRLIRETFRCARPGLNGVDVVVQVLGPMDDARLVRELEEMLSTLEGS